MRFTPCCWYVYFTMMFRAYGFLGASNGMLPCVPIAASVTATGRRMIAQTKALVEEYVPGSRVVYGDSVAGYTPCIARYAGGFCVTTFDSLAELYGDGIWLPLDHCGKESCELRGVDVWSDCGWTLMHRVIRHRAAKPMVRVVTHTGVVDVTADHSLLRDDGTPVSPRDLAVGDALLHTPLPQLTASASSDITVAEARVRGFFFAVGSAGVYPCSFGAKASWALRNADLGLLGLYKDMCQAAFPEYGWRIMPTMESRSVHQVSPRGAYSAIYVLASEFRNSMYLGTAKVIPSCVMGASEEVRRAFWQGMHDAAGNKDSNGYVCIDHESQVSAACVFLLAESLGYKASVKSCNNKPDIYQVTATMGSQCKNPAAIKEMYSVTLGTDQYVYDVTTNNHHFHAGVGRMVVHNTDSVMVILDLGEEKREDMHAHFQAAAAVAQRISKTFPSPVELEFEKASAGKESQ